MSKLREYADAVERAQGEVDYVKDSFEKQVKEVLEREFGDLDWESLEVVEVCLSAMQRKKFPEIYEKALKPKNEVPF